MTAARHRRARGFATVGIMALSVSMIAGGTAFAAAVPQSVAEPPSVEQASPQVLTVAGPVALVDLDPHGPNAVEDPTTQVAQHIFDTVVKHVGDEYEPSLATAWSTPDETTWQFTIRDDVAFTDGTPLTAIDIKASIDRVKALDGPLAPLWAAVTSAEAPDPATLILTTDGAFGGMLTNMSLLFVTPAASSSNEGFFRAPIGSGPFKVASFEPGERLVLDRNADYWGGAPSLDQLVITEIPEVSSRITALTTGEIDFTWGLPADQLPVIEVTDGLTLVTAPSYALYYQWFNSTHKPFDDVRVRQAMWHALDLDTIVSALFPGVGTVSQSSIQPGVFGFLAQQPYSYDPELAKRLLAEAGYPDGFSTSIQFASTCCAGIRELAQAMISQWAEIGVTVEPLEKEQAQWVEDLLALNWDMNVAYNVTTTGDANFTVGRLYTCAANRTGYCSEELDAAITAARGSLDDAERAQHWGEAQTIIWEQAVGVSIMGVNGTYAMNDRVQGFVPPASGIPNFTSVTIGG
ncbi:MAG: ABC transporter substrate-binding protein [Chloroflexi bacterium]|nr:ABC transporter substrate-binding protein [Chloroflexota bacterium]